MAESSVVKTDQKRLVPTRNLMYAYLRNLIVLLGWMLCIGLGAQPYTVNLAAVEGVRLTLAADCSSSLSVAQLLVGDFGGAPASEFSIEVADNNPANGAQVDGCGTFTYIITASEQIIGFNAAWGYVIAEDKTSPLPIQLPENGLAGYCDAVAAVNINLLPAAISRCWWQAGSSAQIIDNSLDAALATRLEAGGGIPQFSDGCSRIEICVADQLLGGLPCENTFLRRTFTARDGDCPNGSGTVNAPTVVSYTLTFVQPSLTEVEGVASTASFDCGTYSSSDPNPLPLPSDYPYLLLANGLPRYLSMPLCNMAATFSDGPRVSTCEQTYKFIRTFTVVDWCEPDEPPLVYTQLVKVGDFTAPSFTAPTQDLDFDGQADEGPLVFSVTSGDCTGLLTIPLPGIQDDCSQQINTQVFVYPFGWLEATPIGPFTLGQTVMGLPLGNHLLRYVLTDDCDNAATLDMPIRLTDGTAPTAICENDIHLSLDSGGQLILQAADIDGGSSDHCTAVNLQLALLDNDNQPLTTYAPTVVLRCDNIGTIRLGLRVNDAAGNLNYCWLDAIVEDKLAPICVPPSSRAVNCTDLQGLLPANLAAFFDQDTLAAITLLDAQFGQALGQDNCPSTSITQSVVDNRNSCGLGSIQRTFKVQDEQGLFNGQACRQFISVGALHDYSIRLPEDEEVANCLAPNYVGVQYTTAGCDLITVATRLDTFMALSSECYKLRITYDLINWCEYSGTQNAYNIPRDADNDNVVREVTWLHIVPRNLMNITDDLAYLDRDAIRENGNTIANLDTGDGGLLPGSHLGGYGVDGSRGAFSYRQFVKVYDNTPPVLVLQDTSTVGFDDDGDCLADIVLPFSVADDCSAHDLHFSIQLDAFIEDTNGDGIFTLSEFRASSDVSPSLVAATSTAGFELRLSNLPLGQHAVRILVSDGCGNISVGLMRFEIVDRKAPSPICINGLTVTLMPDGAGGGVASIWASDFIASAALDCSGLVRYSLYKEETAIQAGFMPSVLDTGLLLNCGDDSLLVVRIYAFDPVGNYDYCETFLQVQWHEPDLCLPNTGGLLAGQIYTLDDEALGGVTVFITGNEDLMATTDALGNFYFNQLAYEADYTLLPYSDSDHMNGVSTFDILAISRHILGSSPFTSPYQYIAADANRSQEITVRDLIVVRRLILGLDDNFDNNTSWRFIEAAYTFPEATNPWAEVFPELINVNNFSTPQTVAFTAVKVGDINRDADPRRLLSTGNAAPSSSTARATAQFVANIRSRNGQYSDWAIYSPADQELLGFQATLSWASGVELVEIIDGQLGANEHFGYRFTDRSCLTLAYHTPAGFVSEEVPLFTLRLRHAASQPMDTLLRFDSQFTLAEAYTAAGEFLRPQLRLQSNTHTQNIERTASLEGAFPNPLVEKTLIYYTSKEATEAWLTIFDPQGRLVHQARQKAIVGRQAFLLRREQLATAMGVYTYTLQIGSYKASQQLLVQ